MSRLTNRFMGIGGFEQTFEARPHLLRKFIPGRHLIFRRGVEIYWTGVITEPGRREGDQIVVQGAGVEWWGGEDAKHGAVRLPQTTTALRTDQIVDNLLFRTDGTRWLNPGVLNLGNVIGSFSWAYEGARHVIRRLARITRTEYRTRGAPDFALDWAGNVNGGRVGQTRNLVLAEEVGTAREVSYEPSTFHIAGRVYALGKGEGDAIIVASATTALPATWKDWAGNPVQRDLVIDAPNADTAQEAQFVADAQLGSHSQVRRTATVELSSDTLLGLFDEGDELYVYKRLVLEDPLVEVFFRERNWPAVLMRVMEVEVELGTGWEVALRDEFGNEEPLTELCGFTQDPKVIVKLSSDPDSWYEGDDTDAILTDSRTTAQPPDPNADPTTPAAPAGLTITPSTYEDYAGQQRARLHFEWTAVTQNTDGSAIVDLQEYIVRYRRVAGAPTAWETLTVGAPDVKVAAEDLPVGIAWEAQVAAMDQNGNQSAWAPAVPVNTNSAADTTPPPQPMTPVATGGINVVFVEWDHKDAAANPMPPDIRWYEVHASQTSGFTPTSATLKGETNATMFSFPGANGTWFVKLIAVDFANNKSAPSAESNGADSHLVQTFDLDVQAVSAANIADGAIATAKIADGAVTIEKLAVGTLVVDALVAGNFDNLALDQSFEKSVAGAIPTGTHADPESTWFVIAGSGGGAAIVSDPTNARTGAKCAKVSGNAGSYVIRNGNLVDARAGDEFYIEGFVKTLNGATGTGGVRITWLDANHAELSATPFVGAAPGNVQTQRSGVATAPAGTVYARPEFLGNNQTTGDWFFDDLYLHKRVVSAYISDAAIITAKIADASITTAKIVDAAIVTAKIGDLQVNTAKIADLAVNTAKIGDAVITSAKIADAAIVNAKIANLAVTNAKIADAAITNAKINDLDAAKINVGTLRADLITVATNPTAGNNRMLLNQNGIDFFTPLGADATQQYLQWWREGTADGSPYFTMGGFYASGIVAGTIFVQEKSGSVLSKIQLICQNSIGSINQAIFLDQQQDHIDIDADWNGSTSKGRLLLHKGVQSDGHVIDAQLYSGSTFKINGGALFITNAAWTSLAPVGGGKASTNVSYGVGIHGSSAVPDVMLSVNNSNNAMCSAIYSDFSRSGATIRVLNHAGGTETFVVIYWPLVI